MNQSDAIRPSRTALSRRALLLATPALALAGCNRSPAIGSVMPPAELAPIPGLRDAANGPVPGFAADEFHRGVSLLNVWASWCPDCRAEHDQLLRLASDGRFRVLGLAFRDKPAAVAHYLGRAGNPYVAAAMDDGRLTGHLNQKGVPYSYVLSRSGRILAVVRGTLDEKAVETVVLPTIRMALAAEAGTVG